MFKLLLMLPLTFGSVLLVANQPSSNEQIARGEERRGGERRGGEHEGEHHGAEAGRFHDENIHHDLNHAGNLNTGGGAVVPVVEPIQTTPIVIPPSN